MHLACRRLNANAFGFRNDPLTFAWIFEDQYMHNDHRTPHRFSTLESCGGSPLMNVGHIGSTPLSALCRSDRIFISPYPSSCLISCLALRLPLRLSPSTIQHFPLISVLPSCSSVSVCVFCVNNKACNYRVRDALHYYYLPKRWTDFSILRLLLHGFAFPAQQFVMVNPFSMSPCRIKTADGWSGQRTAIFKWHISIVNGWRLPSRKGHGHGRIFN